MRAHWYKLCIHTSAHETSHFPIQDHAWLDPTFLTYRLRSWGWRDVPKPAERYHLSILTPLLPKTSNLRHPSVILVKCLNNLDWWCGRETHLYYLYPQSYSSNHYPKIIIRSLSGNIVTFIVNLQLHFLHSVFSLPLRTGSVHFTQFHVLCCTFLYVTNGVNKSAKSRMLETEHFSLQSKSHTFGNLVVVAV